MVCGGCQMSGDVERGRRGRSRGRSGCGRHHGSRILVLQFAAAGLILAKYARDGKRRIRYRGRLNCGGRRLASATTVARDAGRRGRGHGCSGAATVATGRRVVVVVVVTGHVDARRRFGHDDKAAAASVAAGTVVLRDSIRFLDTAQKKKKK